MRILARIARAGRSGSNCYLSCGAVYCVRSGPVSTGSGPAAGHVVFCVLRTLPWRDETDPLSIEERVTSLCFGKSCG